jgi:hypothetical protein
MPGPGSGENQFAVAIGNGPRSRPGSAAGAQGGPAGFADSRGLAASRLPRDGGGFGAGVMAGPDDGGDECAISPMMLLPCQPPGAGQPLLAGAVG